MTNPTNALSARGRTCVVAGFFLIFGTALAVFVSLSAPASLTPPPLWLIFALLAVSLIGEMNPVAYEYRRNALSLSLADFALVFSVFFVPPLWVVAIRVAAGVGFQLLRHRNWLKHSVNVGIFLTEASLVLLFVQLFRTREVGNPSSWLVILAALIVANTLSSYSIHYILRPEPVTKLVQRTLTIMPTTVVVCTFCTALGVLAALALTATWWSFTLIFVIEIATVFGYGMQQRLVNQRLASRQLLDLTRANIDGGSPDELMPKLVTHAGHTLNARDAMIRPPGSIPLPEGPDGPLTSFVAPRGTREPHLRAWLDQMQLQDAAVVQMSPTPQLTGTLVVANRLGHIRTFSQDDLAVLQTLAVHFAAILKHSALVEQLRHDARHDALTGLDNRARFLERISEHLAQHSLVDNGATIPQQGVESCHGAVLILQIDLYSTVSDALGQHVADVLLVHVASRLDTCLPERMGIARVGDDQFGVFLPTCESESDIQGWVRTIQQQLQEPLETQGMLLDTSPCFGYVMLPQDGGSAEDALQNAHFALMTTKKSAQPKDMARYSRSETDISLYRLMLAGELRRGIANNEISVIFQPKVDTLTGRVVGFESLARWEHPQSGLIMPDEFIPLAESTGQLAALTLSVLDQALHRASQWLPTHPDTGISVNLSAVQLLDATLPLRIAESLERYQVPAEALTMEITESRLMAQPAAARKAMDALHELGVRVSVDDFGTGYSSLSYLQTLPVDEVKIDKSFILPLLRSEQNQAIVRTVINLVHTLDMKVVAEGVETSVVRDLLAEEGCDVIQGFLVGRGLAGDRVDVWLREWEASQQNAHP